MDCIIRIANRNILIQGTSDFFCKACRGYLADEGSEPEIRIRIDESMIRAEATLHQENGETLSAKAAENVLVHRLIAEAMLDRGAFLMHGAVIATGNEAYLFSARSGTGKTTHMQKWLQNDKNAYVVNGDKPLILIRPDGAYACGTPWCGKEHLGTNAVVRLRSIVFMQRSEDNRMETVSFRSALPMLLEQIYQPADARHMKTTLALLSGLREHTTFYKFRFNNFRYDAFRVSYDILTNQD
ncbi:MAG: hypothetical protein IJK28_04795 [Clostridia bacterium]|nr:hypothetical protein [Clostridia bacterium]